MEIVKVGGTLKGEDGEVVLVLDGDIPEDCGVIFVPFEDVGKAKRLLSEEE